MCGWPENATNTPSAPTTASNPVGTYQTAYAPGCPFLNNATPSARCIKKISVYESVEMFRISHVATNPPRYEPVSSQSAPECDDHAMMDPSPNWTVPRTGWFRASST